MLGDLHDINNFDIATIKRLDKGEGKEIISNLALHDYEFYYLEHQNKRIFDPLSDIFASFDSIPACEFDEITREPLDMSKVITFHETFQRCKKLDPKATSQWLEEKRKSCKGPLCDLINAKTTHYTTKDIEQLNSVSHALSEFVELPNKNRLVRIFCATVREKISLSCERLLFKIEKNASKRRQLEIITPQLLESLDKGEKIEEALAFITKSILKLICDRKYEKLLVNLFLVYLSREKDATLCKYVVMAVKEMLEYKKFVPRLQVYYLNLISTFNEQFNTDPKRYFDEQSRSIKRGLNFNLYIGSTKEKSKNPNKIILGEDIDVLITDTSYIAIVRNWLDYHGFQSVKVLDLEYFTTEHEKLSIEEKSKIKSF
ncbi:hypothetical protein ROZALSC1DRAFT_27526 [Rozella allomycis CSF55]|uniref:Uncharacterized protein n=1 Tax=Rozella allomycis (strain CSF55) TaxID=988480 RepID=A0A075AXP5_ROZAC|nr:hypothetical protein O9G_003203 [Rozella allomycis CSF55]RKP21027.1 hypothetical protein ROZALSC1DRAFT_27526 [Rozella allomycis CSF55]|eukprot:EPZ35017.1 hypothetical protein O9G_003203 [Rozella allomycis CSF55]